MSATDKFLFDTNGYVILKGVLTPEEVAAANAAIDHHADAFLERKGALRNTKDGTPLAGDGSTGRFDCGGFLQWEQPHVDVFRSILAHPRLVPYLNELCGQGYRLDHSPLLFKQVTGSEGFSLHGGPMTEDGAWNPLLSYQFNHGRMYNTLLACSLNLTPARTGDGGFCIVKGSHKSNFVCPPEMVHGAAHTEHLYQPETEAGDVVLFTESSFHGTLPWAAAHERRVGLYRFAPATMAYGRAYFPRWPAATYAGASVQQRAVLEAPYNPRLDRVCLTDAGEAHTLGRAGWKKAFDKDVFNNEYF